MKKFKIFEIEAGEAYHLFKEDDFSAVENVLEQYSAEGWEVVSVCPNNYMDNIHGNFLVTLQRDKQ